MANFSVSTGEERARGFMRQRERARFSEIRKHFLQHVFTYAHASRVHDMIRSQRRFQPITVIGVCSHYQLMKNGFRDVDSYIG